MNGTEKTRPAVMRARGVVAAAWALSLLLAGCDRLMDVKLPGQLLEEDLDNPGMAAMLARSAQAEFECAFQYEEFAGGLWTSDFYYTGTEYDANILNQRTAAAVELQNQDCMGTRASLWGPLSAARVQGEGAAERILDFEPSDVVSQPYVVAKSYAYGGYSTLLLAEGMCSLAFDAGPEVTREAGFNRAVTNLKSALEWALKSSDSDAASIANMARVGLARAYLNLGDGPKVVEYASQVPFTFVRNVTASTAAPRRYNRVYNYNQVGLVETLSVHPSYWSLTVDGVPDPRVQVLDGGHLSIFDGHTPIGYQLKFPERSSPIPLATGREAQLMIAEVQGGQEAVAIINKLRDTYSLPHFASTDATAIRDQVREERRRELWLHNTRLGDMLRWGIPFPSGQLPRGPYYGDQTCFPLPETETLTNPNIAK